MRRGRAGGGILIKSKQYGHVKPKLIWGRNCGTPRATHSTDKVPRRRNCTGRNNGGECDSGGPTSRSRDPVTSDGRRLRFRCLFCIIYRRRRTLFLDAARLSGRPSTCIWLRKCHVLFGKLGTCATWNYAGCRVFQDLCLICNNVMENIFMFSNRIYTCNVDPFLKTHLINIFTHIF